MRYRVGSCGETGTKAAPFHRESQRIGFPPNLDEGDLRRGQRITAKVAPFFLAGYMIRGPRPRTTNTTGALRQERRKSGCFLQQTTWGLRSKSPRKADLPIWRSRHRVFTNASSNSNPRALRRRRWGFERERGKEEAERGEEGRERDGERVW